MPKGTLRKTHSLGKALSLSVNSTNHFMMLNAILYTEFETEELDPDTGKIRQVDNSSNHFCKEVIFNVPYIRNTKQSMDIKTSRFEALVAYVQSLKETLTKDLTAKSAKDVLEYVRHTINTLKYSMTRLSYGDEMQSLGKYKDIFSCLLNIKLYLNRYKKTIKDNKDLLELVRTTSDKLETFITCYTPTLTAVSVAKNMAEKEADPKQQKQVFAEKIIQLCPKYYNHELFATKEVEEDELLEFDEDAADKFETLYHCHETLWNAIVNNFGQGSVEADPHISQLTIKCYEPFLAWVSQFGIMPLDSITSDRITHMHEDLIAAKAALSEPTAAPSLKRSETPEETSDAEQPKAAKRVRTESPKPAETNTEESDISAPAAGAGAAVAPRPEPEAAATASVFRKANGKGRRRGQTREMLEEASAGSLSQSH